MHVDVDEFSRRLQGIGTCDAVVPLRQATMDALGLFGISAAYFLAPITRDPRVARVITNWGLPWKWERPYRERYYRHDPLPQIAADRLQAVLWPDTIDRSQLSARQLQCLDFAATVGLARGIGVACFGPDGRSGFLGAVLPADAPVPDPLALECIHALGQKAFQAYCRIIKRHMDLPALSNRELEVLHWMARGKSNSVIAEILSISPSSVDVYVRRIFAKLGVTDRTSASLKAYSQGLLVSSDYERFVAEQEQARMSGPGQGDGAAVPDEAG